MGGVSGALAQAGNTIFGSVLTFPCIISVLAGATGASSGTQRSLGVSTQGPRSCMHLPLLCLSWIQTDSLVMRVAWVHGSMPRRYFPISALSVLGMPHQRARCMHMATAHSHILIYVRNLSEVKLQRREEVHAALCLLHVMFPLLLSARNGCFVRCVRVHLMHCGPICDGRK